MSITPEAAWLLVAAGTLICAGRYFLEWRAKHARLGAPHSYVYMHPARWIARGVAVLWAMPDVVRLVAGETPLVGVAGGVLLTYESFLVQTRVDGEGIYRRGMWGVRSYGWPEIADVDITTDTHLIDEPDVVNIRLKDGELVRLAPLRGRGIELCNAIRDGLQAARASDVGA